MEKQYFKKEWDGKNMKKKIIVGEIEEEFQGTPLHVFKKAMKISEFDDFIIHTNNPQVVETLEVLCGEANIEYYIKQDGDLFQQYDVRKIYNYIGDIYDIIDGLRLDREFDNEITEETINEEILEYEIKHNYKDIKDTIEEDKFEKYEVIPPEPVFVDAYKTDKTIILNTSIGNEIVPKGDYVIRKENGAIISTKASRFHKTYRKIK